MVRWSSLPLQPGTIHWTRLVVAQGNKMPWETTTTYNDNIYIIVADKGKDTLHDTSSNNKKFILKDLLQQ